MFGFFKKKAEPKVEQIYPYIKITENGLGEFRMRLHIADDFSFFLPVSNSIANMTQAENEAKKYLELRRKEREIVNISKVY